MDTLNIIGKLDAASAQFKNSFEELGQDELNWKPAENRWSIAQVMDHLITINTSYFPILDQIRDGIYTPPFMARVPFMASLFGTLIHKSMKPDTKTKTSTFPIWEPSYSEIKGDILQRFLAHQEELKSKINACDGPASNEVVIASPASSKVVYTLSKALEIIADHEVRHYNQAMEVLSQLKETTTHD